MTGWQDVSPGGQAYADRFARLAASGADVHGEATLVEAISPGPRVLDAGCGTGRVAIRLRDRGFDVAGVDLDPDMLAVARATAPQIPWYDGDLAALDLPGAYDLVLAAGNVLPLVADRRGTVAAMARVLAPGGLLVAGFGLDAAHLPIPAPTLDLPGYDALCAEAGLRLTGRWSTWDRQPYDGGGYAVSVHALASPA